MNEKVFIFPEDEDVPGAQTHVIVDNTPLPITGTVTEVNSPAILADLNQVVTNTAAALTQSQLETELDEKFGDLGQKNMAGSAPVVIASNQSAIPVSGTVAVTQSTSPWVVSGTVTATVGVVDANNSTTALLLANAVYTGTGTSILNYSIIEVLIYSDVSSASNKVYIEFSSDNVNWDDSSVFTFTSGGTAPNAGQVFVAAVRGQYYRIVYTNGPANQTAFRMQAVLKSNIVGGDVLSVNQTINANNHALLTTSQIVGLSTAGGGTYVTVKVTPSGAVTNALGDISGVVGQNTMANSLPVTIASNQTAIPTNTTPTVSSTLAPTRFANLGANATLNIKATPGNVFSLTCYNANASSRYIQLHDTATVPGGGAVPLYTFLVPTGGQVVIGTDFFTRNGVYFGTGIAFAFSTTLNTYTAGTAGDQTTIVMYI